MLAKPDYELVELCETLHLSSQPRQIFLHSPLDTVSKSKLGYHVAMAYRRGDDMFLLTDGVRSLNGRYCE